MSRPVIALLTDFGTKDFYAAAVKGVLLSGCPEASLVDITHDVAPFDVLEAALVLESVYRFFPRERSSSSSSIRKSARLVAVLFCKRTDGVSSDPTTACWVLSWTPSRKPRLVK